MIQSYVEIMKLEGQLQVTSWNEDDLRTLQEGGKVTRASVGYRMTGDVDGEAIDDAVMCYREDGTATVVGLWQMVGTVAGRRGSVMFESSGSYDGATAAAEVRTVPGSSTGDFAGVRGTGSTCATREHIEYVLDLEF